MQQDFFIPFGFQYYRSPTPYADQWENDLRQIAHKGFNCVKYWIQWRASSPAEDVFQFDDIRTLMDLAERQGLRVVLNVIFDVAPAWFYRKYPDSLMVTADGAVLEPRAISCRQIGGAPGPCYHHDPAQREKDRFLAAAVEAFADHPALWAWDLWNEPELTTSIKRPLSFANQVCYCQNSLSAFSQWLKQKYLSLEAFNFKWQRNYQSWDEIEAPRGQAVFNDLVDWRLFMSDALTADLKRRIETVKLRDRRHPVMAHTVPAPIFNLITAGSDDFKLAAPCDLFGNSLGSSAWAADLLKSAAKGKRLINSEIHALPGDTAMKPAKLSLAELKRHILIPLACGITGFLFWQYRPEVLGHEAPAWGSTYMDGSETPWLNDMAALNAQIQNERELLMNAVRPSDGIAVWFGAENQIANFSVYGHLDTYHASVQGAHKLLHDLNYKVEFLSDQEITPHGLAPYRCLWLPYPLYLNEEMCRTLREWVANGGTLISECSFGALMAESGVHSSVVPGYGFDEVFGVRETWIHSLAQLDHSYHQVTLESGNTIPLTWTGTDSEASKLPAVPVAAGSQSTGGRSGGAYYKTDLTLRDDVEVMARYAEDQAPAITATGFGKGKAIWIGTLLSAAYWQEGSTETRKQLSELLANLAKVQPIIRVEGSGTIRADWMQGQSENKESRQLLFVHNWGSELSSATLYLPCADDRAEPWFEEGASLLQQGSGPGVWRVELSPGDIQVYSLHGATKEVFG